MREILFKGKDFSGMWHEGTIFPQAFGGWKIRCVETHYGDTYIDDYLIKDDSISEFIGLTDKNGTKIFEGDILAFENYYGEKWVEGVVRYGEFNCSCCDGVYGWYIDGGDIRYIEKNHLYVIGNIHDNPERWEDLL